MYAFFKQAIKDEAYTDLNAFLTKLHAAWGRDQLTDEQLDELRAAAQGNAPRKVYDLQEELDRLWTAVRELQAEREQSAASSGGNGAAGSEVRDFVQPGGAHDAYGKGDVVRYKGKLYASTLDGNVWAPDVYPAGWEELAANGAG